MSYRYRLAILNDGECPEPRMVIVAREQNGKHEWAYVSAWRDLDHFRGWRELRCPDRITELEAFGVRPVIELSDGGHELFVERVAESTAQYSDGKPRRWQAPPERRTRVLPSMLPALTAYTRQIGPKQATAPESK